MTVENNISRLARITSIATLLKSKRVLTATDIAKKFGVSVRTVYRDIRELEHSGMPIITVEGKGYSLMEGYTLPALMFTEAEMNALIAAEHIINETKDASLAKNFNEALVKIKSIIRYGLKEKSELLSARTLVKKKSSEGTTSSLSLLQSAITNYTLIKIMYQKPDDASATTRFVEPQALCYVNENWILIAWCRLRNDYRAFRIDRIQKIELQNSNFKTRNFDLKQYLNLPS